MVISSLMFALGGTNSGPFTCVARTSPTKPAPQAQSFVLLKVIMTVMWTGHCVVVQCLCRCVNIRPGQLVIPSLQAFSISLNPLCCSIVYCANVINCSHSAGLSDGVSYLTTSLFSFANLPLFDRLVIPFCPLKASTF